MGESRGTKDILAPLDKLSILFPAFLDRTAECEVSASVGERVKDIVGKGKRIAGNQKFVVLAWFI